MVQTYDYLEARLISLEKTVEEMKQTVENFIQTLPTELENILTTKLQQCERKLDEKIGELHESIAKATIPTEEVPLKVTKDTYTKTKEEDLVTSDRISEDENSPEETETGYSNKETKTEKKIDKMMEIVEELNSNTIEEIRNVVETVEQINSKMDAVEEVKEGLFKINDINAKLERQDELLKGLQTDGKDAKPKLEQIEKCFTKEITELRRLENVTSPGQSIKMKGADGVIKEKKSNGHYSNWGPEHDHLQDCFFVSIDEIRTLLQHLQQEDHKIIEEAMSKRIFKDVKVVNKYTRFPNTGGYVDLNNKETQTKLNDAICYSKTKYCTPWCRMTCISYYYDFYGCLSSAFLGKYQNTDSCRKYGVYDLKIFEEHFGLEWIC